MVEMDPPEQLAHRALAALMEPMVITASTACKVSRVPLEPPDLQEPLEPPDLQEQPGGPLEQQEPLAQQGSQVQLERLALRDYRGFWA